MLGEQGIDFEYREYKKNPLSLDELKALMQQLDVPANAILRKRESIYKELGLTSTEDDATLLPLMAKHPALMERPIFIHNNKAVLCRPHDRLLSLL